MLSRSAAVELERKLRTFPIVTLLGPRQVGKTTLARTALPGWSYVDAERPSHREPLVADPEDRLRTLGDRVTIDEAQLVPEVFPVLRALVDENRKRNGRYVLLGSASPTLVKTISETLAGRSAFMELGPLSWEEVHAAPRRISLEDLWLRGGFPDACLTGNSHRRFDWMDAYSRTFIERDLAALGVQVSAPQMRKLWGLLAHAQGTLWNASRFAESLGTNYHTVNRYADILEQAFLIRRLPPFLPNLSKRLIKSPKLYFRDNGLLHYFLGISERETLAVHPARGESWEGFVIEQVIAGFRRHAPGAQFFFFRTATGTEVDLVVQLGSKLLPFEIKSHTSPGADSSKGLQAFMTDLKLTAGFIIARSEHDYSLGNGVTVLSAKKLLAETEALTKLGK